MKTHKMLILLFLLLFGLSFSCGENGETTYIYQEVVDYETEFLELLDEGVYTQTTGEYLDSTSIIKYNKLQIGLFAETHKISKNKRAKLHSSFFAAKADDVVPKIKGTLKNITIKTNVKYNDTYTTGSIINDILIIDYQTETWTYDGPIQLNVFNNSDHPCSGGGFFYLTVPPDTTRTCSFTFIIKHANDSVFKTQTIPITITP